MARRLPALNLTALLALSALADLILYRVLGAAFLPAQPGTLAERCLVDLGAFAANFSGILALLLVATALVRALGTDRIFPRSMRITVTTIGLFFTGLAAMGVLWYFATPRYHIHLRISHGFLVLFLTVGVWQGSHALRAKLGVSMFAVPMVLEAIAFFCHRMGWTRIEPAQIVRVAHAITWAAMCATPVLLAPRPRRNRDLALALGSGFLLGSSLGAVTALRFDLVQAVAFYGLRIDLTGLASRAELLFTAALIAAVACLGAAIVSCLVARGPHRLTGWGLVLLAVAGQELSSAKPALFTLCGLLALSVASARAGSGAAMPSSPPDAEPHTNPAPNRGLAS
jgi:hypothetical protein